MRTPAADTRPEAERILVRPWGQVSLAKKPPLIPDNTRAMQDFTPGGLRARHPDESLERLRRRLAAPWLGPNLARRSYDPTPDETE